MTEKRNIQKLVDKESDNLHNILDPNDVKAFKDLTEELRDTWTKKQIFRTETEMRFSVLNDYKYPSKAAKYWQCVREQNVYLEQLMQLSFDYRRNDVKIKRLEKKIQEEKDNLKIELFEIDLDEKKFSKASMELTAKDRMREIKLWSKIKKEVDDGKFDKNNVDIVITWAVGARSINYWQKCLVISLFIFDLKEELRQCGGRSNRNFPRDKLIQIRVVVNAETVKRQKDDQEAAKKMEEGKEGVRFELMHSG